MLLLASGPGLAQPDRAAETPLPDRDTFLRAVRARLHADETLLRPFTYRRTVIERDRDDQGNVTATRTRVYEVRPLPDDPRGYRILLERNGTKTSAADLKRADDDYRRRLADFARNDSAGARRRREARAAERAEDERETVEDVIRIFEVRLVRRETMNGIACILLEFAPRPGVEARTRNGRYVQNVKGKAWFAEDEHELVRLEAVVFEPITMGWGIIARINEGAKAVIERQRMPDGKWLPARYHFTGEGRVMLLKTVQRDATVVFSDYRFTPLAVTTP